MELFREPSVSRAADKLPKKQELRCFCARRPLLARYGHTNGKLFVHVLVHKQNRIYCEILVTEGIVQIHCRECLRWHTVKIVQPNRVSLEESVPPEVLPSG